MSIRRIANVAYHFAQRARSRQELDGMGIEGSLAGKRVVISTDGGRLRIRKNKRGQKTKKGFYKKVGRDIFQFLYIFTHPVIVLFSYDDIRRLPVFIHYVVFFNRDHFILFIPFISVYKIF